MLHLPHVNEINPAAVVVVWCIDTDVLCILGHHMKWFSAKVYMDTGFNSDNTSEYINVTKLSVKIRTMCEVLLTVHALTGCDYTAAFMRKDKVKIYNKLESSEQYQGLFAEFGVRSQITDNRVDEAEKFVCEMYGKFKLSTLAEARYALFRATIHES